MSSDALPNLPKMPEYQLLEKLGEGGMGAVYKARHTALDRVAAVKVLPAGRMANDQAVARFRREMKAVGRLDHPNIVRAHDAREVDGIHVLVMEYVDGLDLTTLVQRQGPLRVADACEIVRQAALGLDHAHRHGLIHRDVKPSNLMLTAEGRVKILDLGLARFHTAPAPGDETTASGQIMGTPDYMAPEQTSDSRSVDARADIYGLGCTFYKLLAGHAPFSGPSYASAFDKMVAHTRDPVPPIEQHRDDVPAGVSAALKRMLAKRPEDRPATAGEVADAVGPWTEGCDLPALLARCHGEVTPPRQAAGSTGEGRRQRTEPEGAEAAGRRAPPAAPVPIRRRRWALAAAGAVLILGLVLVAVFMNRNPDSTPRDSEQEGIAAGQSPAGDDSPEASDEEQQTGVAGRNIGRDWIVLSWTVPRLGKPNLWLFSPDGVDRRPVTRSPDTFDVQPHFSPNRRRIVFTRGTNADRPESICVCDTDGGNLRRLVDADREQERVASPVWVSDSRIYYARQSGSDPPGRIEIWRVDVDDPQPQRVFRFGDALAETAGLVTDVSPDGTQLALIAQRGPLWPTANVLIADLEGKVLATIWSDVPDDRKDARALWSPSGDRIAWQHTFSPGMMPPGPMYYGVGQAVRTPDGDWKARVQPDEETAVVPLAWSPDGDVLLCAEIHETPRRLPGATLFLMDHEFHKVREMFHLPACPWVPKQRDYGRLADWARLPPDAPLPKKPPLP